MLARHYGGVPAKIVKNAVDLNRFSPGSGEDLDVLAGLPPAGIYTVRVGLVATYAKWKGHLTFLDAALLLAKSDPVLPVRWFIIGGPIYQTTAQFSDMEASETAVSDRGLSRSDRIHPISTKPGRCVSRTRYRRSRFHSAGTIRLDRFGGNGLWQTGRGVRGGRSNRVVHRRTRRAWCESRQCIGDVADAVRRLANDPTLRDRLRNRGAGNNHDSFRR